LELGEKFIVNAFVRGLPCKMQDAVAILPHDNFGGIGFCSGEAAGDRCP